MSANVGVTRFSPFCKNEKRGTLLRLGHHRAGESQAGYDRNNLHVFFGAVGAGEGRVRCRDVEMRKGGRNLYPFDASIRFHPNQGIEGCRGTDFHISTNFARDSSTRLMRRKKGMGHRMRVWGMLTRVEYLNGGVRACLVLPNILKWKAQVEYHLKESLFYTHSRCSTYAPYLLAKKCCFGTKTR